ncbi:MAG TPA: glycosyltransferase family 4 protein [bacterium]|nr:glycosyltransferase family 4 protein [bacterium]
MHAERGRCKKIRVLHVITRMILGGAQENTLMTAVRLDRSRYDVTLASGPTYGPEGSLEGRIPDDLPLVRIPDLVRDPHPLKDLRALAALARVVRLGRYHIVHTHTTKAGLLGRIAARWAGTPVVVHTPHGHAFHSFLNAPGSAALVWVERAVARWTDRIICLTEAERRDHLNLRIGPPGRFEVIHSGVDLGRFGKVTATQAALRMSFGVPATGSIIACVARLAPVKGVRYLIEAMPRVRDAVPAATAVIVGDGPERAKLQARASALGLNGAVKWLGLRTDVPEIMSLADVVVLPSLNEGMGRVVVEAFAAGRPVVGSRVSGIQDLVADGETGYLVPSGDPRAIAEAVVCCLRDPERARAMGISAQRTAAAFSAERMVAKIDALYARLLAAKGCPA